MSTKGRRKRHQQTHVGAVRYHFHVRGRSAARDDRMGTRNDPMSDDAIGMQASDLIGREGCEGRGPRESPRSRSNAGRGPRPPEGAAVDDRPRHDPLVGGERSVGASGGDHVHLVPLSRERLRLRTYEVPCGVRIVGGIGRGDDGNAHGASSMVQRSRNARVDEGPGSGGIGVGRRFRRGPQMVSLFVRMWVAGRLAIRRARSRGHSLGPSLRPGSGKDVRGRVDRRRQGRVAWRP